MEGMLQVEARGTGYTSIGYLGLSAMSLNSEAGDVIGTFTAWASHDFLTQRTTRVSITQSNCPLNKDGHK